MIARERILFLYLSTGGGHIAAARALAAECARCYTPQEVEIHILDCIPSQETKLPRVFIEHGYRFVTLSLPFIWPVLYQLTTIPLLMHYYTKAMTLLSSAHIRHYIRQHNITRVVNLHFLITAPLLRALRQLGRLDMPTVTIITDPYSCHPIWFFRQFSPLVVFSRQALKHAKRHLRWIGIPTLLLPRQRELMVHPIILNPQFNRALSSETCLELREKYGFPRHKRLILITGGGEGLPGGENCLQAIVRAELDVEIAFVCGKNLRQREDVENIAKQSSITRISVYGFIDFMYELMNMADIILTKAGPATLFEALMLKKPLILTRRLYGQEQGNVDFVVKNKLGWFIPQPQAITAKIREILAHPEIAEQVMQNIAHAQITNGTGRIVKYIMNLPLKPEKRLKFLATLYAHQ